MWKSNSISFKSSGLSLSISTEDQVDFTYPIYTNVVSLVEGQITGRTGATEVNSSAMTGVISNVINMVGQAGGSDSRVVLTISGKVYLETSSNTFTDVGTALRGRFTNLILWRPLFSNQSWCYLAVGS